MHITRALRPGQAILSYPILWQWWSQRDGGGRDSSKPNLKLNSPPVRPPAHSGQTAAVAVVHGADHGAVSCRARWCCGGGGVSSALPYATLFCCCASRPSAASASTSASASNLANLQSTSAFVFACNLPPICRLSLPLAVPAAPRLRCCAVRACACVCECVPRHPLPLPLPGRRSERGPRPHRHASPLPSFPDCE